MSDDSLDSWWIQLAAFTDAEILKEAYYLDIWAKVKPELPWDKLTKAEALAPFQAFWEELPDSMSIHRAPFSKICDLAEEYCMMDAEALKRTAEIALMGYEPDPDFPGTYRRKKA